MLNDMNKELEKVEESSKVLVHNAEDSKMIMKDTADKSASLKTLADGFEVVLNSRSAKRTVITPPLQAKDNNANSLYIFDYSVNGISFYDVDKHINRKKGDVITLKPVQTLDNKTEIRCEIVYISAEVMKDVYFYGARLI